MALNESFRKPATRTRPVVLVAAVDHRHISMYLSALSIRLFDLDFTSGHHAGFGIGVRPAPASGTDRFQRGDAIADQQRALAAELPPDIGRGCARGWSARCR